MKNIEPYVCTKEAPWTPEKGTPAQHPDSINDGECSLGCCEYYRCPNCGKRFGAEVAQ